MPKQLTNFKWVYIMDHWDIHLTGMCKVDDELLFFRLESDQYSRLPLKYAVYRFAPDDAAHFVHSKADFEEEVGTHWTYDDAGEKRGLPYRAKPEHLGPNGIPKFYSRPKGLDFNEAINRSECVGYYMFPNNRYEDDEATEGN